MPSQRDHGRVEEALDASLSKLGVEYVDLYLMHWPMAFDESGRALAAPRIITLLFVHGVL